MQAAACTGKKVYKFFTKANRAAELLRRFKTDAHTVVPYRCAYCRHFHIGNK